MIRALFPPTPEWHEQAVCRSVDPELFFPPPNSNGPDAKRVCRGCPVKQECLTAALTEPDGIWGGLGPQSRRKLRQRLNREAS